MCIVFRLPAQDMPSGYLLRCFFLSPYYIFVCLFVFRVCLLGDFQITVLAFFKELLHVYQASKEHGGKSLIELRSFDLRSLRKLHQGNVFPFSLTSHLYTLCKDSRSLSPLFLHFSSSAPSWDGHISPSRLILKRLFSSLFLIF